MLQIPLYLHDEHSWCTSVSNVCVSTFISSLTCLQLVHLWYVSCSLRVSNCFVVWIKTSSDTKLKWRFASMFVVADVQLSYSMFAIVCLLLSKFLLSEVQIGFFVFCSLFVWLSFVLSLSLCFLLRSRCFSFLLASFFSSNKSLAFFVILRCEVAIKVSGRVLILV